MSTEPGNRVTIPDMGRERLRALNQAGMTWREIGTLEEYQDIPPGSLCTYAKTGYLAKKWRKRMVEPRVRRVAVHTEDVDSAVNTLCKQFDREFLREVVDRVMTEFLYPAFYLSVTRRRSQAKKLRDGSWEPLKLSPEAKKTIDNFSRVAVEEHDRTMRRIARDMGTMTDYEKELAQRTAQEYDNMFLGNPEEVSDE